MLTLVYGENAPSLRQFILNRLKDYDRSAVIEIDNRNNVSLAVLDVLYGPSLFSNKQLIIITPKTVSEVDFKESLIKDLQNSANVEVIIDASALNKNTNVFRLFKKYAKAMEFKLPADYSNFNFVDALFIDTNKTKAMTILSSRNSDEQAFLLIGAIQSGLRNFISSKYDNEIWKKAHPFVKKKIGMFKLTHDKAQKLYKELCNIDYKIKSGRGKAYDLISDFVLYST